MIAAWTGSYELVDLLIQRGARVNVVNGHGTTALHQAVRRGDRLMVQRLLLAGARTDLANSKDETAMEMARRAKEQEHFGPFDKPWARVKARCRLPLSKDYYHKK